MDQATKTEDVLAVYNQLVSVQEQIEVLKGQIKYYDKSARLSAISTELRANETVRPLTIGGWQPTGIAKSALQALINTLKFVANAIIWIVIFLLPVALVLFVVFFLPAYLILRAIRRRRASRKVVRSPCPHPTRGLIAKYEVRVAQPVTPWLSHSAFIAWQTPTV